MGRPRTGRRRPEPKGSEAEQAILEHLGARAYRPATQRQLLHRLDLAKSERAPYRRAVARLLERREIVKGRGGRLSLAGGPARHREEGPSRASGLYQAGRGGHAAVVKPFDPSFSRPVRISAKGGPAAHTGEVVRVKLLRPETNGEPAEGRVTEVLGRPDEPGVDIRAVSWKYGLKETFEPRTLEQAGELPDRIPDEELERRQRFEDPPPVTIDGETAKDFDDAVSVRAMPGGGWRLFVHIADVSHFVAPGSALDREALARGTSVYFPGTVLPMFPERLSNGLCSLVPGEDRLVQTAILDLDRQGRTRRTRFADGVIRSVGRLTYTQVGAFFDGERHGHGVPAALQPMLQAANGLRQALERRRRARGSIDFDLPEPQILMDVEGEMTGVRVEPRNRAHRLIEEFMLAANEAVAGYMRSRRPMFLYRVHERPDPSKIETLAEFVRHLGLSIASDPDTITPGDIQQLLDNAADRKDYPVIAQVALRSMKQARYSTENVGHFGLAAPLYTHFTSPIRRYPDLVVHRLLRALRRRESLQRFGSEPALEKLAADCSRRERNAESAEREVLAWKKIAFVQGQEGEVQEGTVTGVTAFGLFVQLADSLVEGLLHVEALGDDYFDFVSSRLELRGRDHGRVFRLGDRLRVRIDRVDPVLHRVDLSLAGSPRRAAGADRPGRGRGGRRKRGGRSR